MTRQAHRIIVEGLDSTGKSTLIFELMDQFGNLELIRNAKEDKQAFEIWWPQQLDREESPAVPIHDRFFYSELVYGPVIRGHLSVEPVLVDNVKWFLRSTALLIYARPHSDIIRERLNEKPQMEGVSSNLEELLKLYDSTMGEEKSWYRDRFIQYVWTREGELERMTQHVRRYLNGEFDT